MKLKNVIFLMSYLCVLGLSASACADNNNAQPSATKISTPPAVNDALSEQDAQRFGAALDIVKRYYVESVPDKELFDNALHGLLSGLDPHSMFLNEEELKDLKDATMGHFSGLGIEVTPDNGFLKIITPIDDSPAQKAGLQAGDYIIKINDELIKDLSLGDAIKKMRGPTGSTVTLTIVREGIAQPFKVKVVRETIKVASVKGKVLEPGYVYVRISSFQENTFKELIKKVNELKQQNDGNLKGFILDVRNNPGGLLDPAATVVDAFLDAGKIKADDLIVSAKGRYPGANFAIKAKPADIIPGVPMVVLINTGSASGAEIVAGALQDYKRAVLVGTDSFGKGSVQTVIPLDAKTAIKLTTALYYTPSGRSIQAAGIKPDVVVQAMKMPAKNDQAVDEKVYIKEADLKGHLANGNKVPATIIKTNTTLATLAEAAPTEADAVGDDYQLLVALNVLKGLAAVQPDKK